MKKLIRVELRKLFFSVTLLLIAFAADAQKLPNIQETSLRAPTTIKVDGKATEWNNQLQAYNKTTELFYTISNDNDKLYLAIQTADLDIANKIICGGVTFMINGSDKMKDQDRMAITYPELKKDPRSGGVGISKNELPSNLPPIDYTRDAMAMNEQFISLSKDIEVTGIEGTQNMISIYNPEGIKAAALFDEQKVFTCEVAIPLKHLKLPGNEKSLVYSIKLNGSVMVNLRSVVRRCITSMRDINGVMVWEGPCIEKVKALMAPTDFWGEYTLAK